MTKPLYEIVPALRELESRLEDGEDVAASLDALAISLEAKCENIRALCVEWDARAAMLRDEEKRIASLRKPIENASDRLRSYVKDVMTRANMTKIETKLARFTLCDGAESVVVDDEMSVPVEYTRTTITVDKAKILEAHRTSGECVPGTRIERGKTLKIK